jgi:hypothetical protein
MVLLIQELVFIYSSQVVKYTMKWYVLCMYVCTYVCIMYLCMHVCMYVCMYVVCSVQDCVRARRCFLFVSFYLMMTSVRGRNML